MCTPKAHCFVLLLISYLSSFFLVCSCHSFLQEDIIHSNYPTITSNNIVSEFEQADDDLALQNMVSYQCRTSNNVLHHVKYSRQSPAKAPSSLGPQLPPSSLPTKTFNVDDFLAVSSSPSKEIDHTEAFKKAWKEACSSRDGVFLVPENQAAYRVKPINFKGPCRSHFTIKIVGSIEASDNMEDYQDRRHWLVFENIRNFRIEGGGTIDGKGMIWWQNSCKINRTKPCEHAPTAVTFMGCKNMIMDGIRIKNGQQIQLSFQKCTNVRASNLEVTAPESSPNTDGIHVTHTRYIQIVNSLIRTGDDCISIVSGSKNVIATNISCGPGHGISIGSLGKGQSKAHVANILVNKASLSGTTNGVRIKTWQGGRGYAKNIVFENIAMRNVSNPIIIDQNYCDQQTPCSERKSAVQVRNVVYKNIRGTSPSEVALKLDCSGCRGIVLQDVNLLRGGAGEAKAYCHNAKVIYRGAVSPTCPQLI